MLNLIDSVFQLGYDDARNGLNKFRDDYDSWHDIKQKEYELGRLFFKEYGDRFRIRDMKTPYEDSFQFSEAITEAYLSVIRG